MIVAGGTYHEHVAFGGQTRELGGSAYRAAVAVPSATKLVTAVEDDLAPILAGAGKTFSVEVENVRRDKSVEFGYLAEFIEPTIRGADARLLGELHVEAQAALAFGIVEAGDRSFDVGALVYDPQSADDRAIEILQHASFKRAILCGNALEIVSIAQGGSIDRSAHLILEQCNLEAVVVKCGARGCLIVEKESQEWIGAVPSQTVRKLGSGDIFSATFAHAWTSGAGTVDAARIASHSTSWWTSSHADQIPAEVLDGGLSASSERLELSNHGRSPKVYLAGPFFTVAELWLVSQCRTFLQQAGAEVFSPVHDIGLGGAEVAEKDLIGLAGVDAVFAILDGWDPGTLFETGWAKHAEIPIVGVASQLDSIRTTMLAGTGAELHTDFTTGMYRAIWRGLGVGGTDGVK
ncbi:MAG: nucleoside 2-deoxyribosyltransferase [Micrococcales bacterium]|nr:nucleoside 2-deoxyribosyltransferase [Micrococcales bacterium]